MKPIEKLKALKTQRLLRKDTTSFDDFIGFSIGRFPDKPLYEWAYRGVCDHYLKELDCDLDNIIMCYAYTPKSYHRRLQIEGKQIGLDEELCNDILKRITLIYLNARVAYKPEKKDKVAENIVNTIEEHGGIMHLAIFILIALQVIPAWNRKNCTKSEHIANITSNSIKRVRAFFVEIYRASSFPDSPILQSAFRGLDANADDIRLRLILATYNVLDNLYCLFTPTEWDSRNLSVQRATFSDEELCQCNWWGEENITSVFWEIEPFGIDYVMTRYNTTEGSCRSFDLKLYESEGVKYFFMLPHDSVISFLQTSEWANLEHGIYRGIKEQKEGNIIKKNLQFGGLSLSITNLPAEKRRIENVRNNKQKYRRQIIYCNDVRRHITDTYYYVSNDEGGWYGFPIEICNLSDMAICDAITRFRVNKNNEESCEYVGFIHKRLFINVSDAAECKKYGVIKVDSPK